MLCSKMQTRFTKNVSSKRITPSLSSRSRRATAVVRAEDKRAGVNTADRINFVAVGGLENPGSPEVSARIDSGGRLPGGKKKTVRDPARILPQINSDLIHLAYPGDNHRGFLWSWPTYCQGSREDGRLECHLCWWVKKNLRDAN